MKILSLCHKSPYPPKEGGSIAMNMIIEGLIDAGHEVKVFSLQTNKYDFSKEIPEKYLSKTQFESSYVDLSLNPYLAFKCFLQNKSFHIERFIHKSIREKLIQILSSQTFDIIHFESIFLLPYLELINKLSNAKVIVRTHNVEHIIWEELSIKSHNPFKKYYLSHLARTLKNYELNRLNQVDLVVSISNHDTQTFKNLGIKTPIIDVPFGINPDQYISIESAKYSPNLFFIGALNWMPNAEGLKWFLENVWQLIHSKYPKLEFVIAGRETPKWLLQSSYPNVKVIGEVKDAQNFINQHSIMIAPLLSGSGIRIKIIEAMALEKIVITTTKGAQGINYEHLKNLIIADSPNEYVNAISKCLNEFDFTEGLKKDARKLIETDHHSKHIINKLIKYYQNLISQI